MKRLVPLLLLVVAFALGAATVAKLNTYSYVPDAMNEPCGKTVFEWQLLEGRIDTTPVPLNANFDLVRMEGEAKPQGLIVRAYLRPSHPSAIPTSNTLAWNNMVCALGSQTHRIMVKRLGVPPEARRRAAMESDARLLAKCFLLIHLNDRLIEVRNNEQSISVAPNATREEQLAALAKIMSHAPPP